MTNMTKDEIKALQIEGRFAGFFQEGWEQGRLTTVSDDLFYHFSSHLEMNDKMDCCNKIRLSIILTWALLHSFHIFRGWKEYDRQSALITITNGFQVWILSEIIIWASLDVGSCHGCSSFFKWWVFLHLYFDGIVKYEPIAGRIILPYGKTAPIWFAVWIAVRIQHEQPAIIFDGLAICFDKKPPHHTECYCIDTLFKRFIVN